MKSWIRNNRGFIVFLLLLGLMRTAVADWNYIPSASMHPTLVEGDLVLVDRVAFDLKLPLTDRILVRLGEPRRGDIVVFSSPKDGTRLIKRLVALPGDTVEMRHKRLIINGQAARYAERDWAIEALGDQRAVRALRLTETADRERRIIQWLPDIAARDDFGPLVVPDGQYLMLGDNRDDSADSRYFGFVPRNLLIGRAERVLVSMDEWQPRTERFGLRLR
jgi:signal peptidase I